MSLDAIGRKFGTDKSSLVHGYLAFYETYFGPRRHEPLTLLEIGVLNGQSLQVWEAYFPAARIVGMDIEPRTLRFQRERVTMVLADQSNIDDLTALALAHGPFDIIIEDGSHMWDHQVTTLRTLFPFLRNGGFYVAEDLQTNYGGMAQGYRGRASASCMDLLKRWADLRVADEQLPLSDVDDAFLRTYGHSAAFIAFHRHACVIGKQHTPLRRVHPPGQALIADPAPGRLPLRLDAHVANIGDVVGTEGFVNSGAVGHPIQGLCIDADDNVLEYRVRSENGDWGAWVAAGGFAGTRGRSIPLSGATVRLRPGHAAAFALRVCGLFAGGGRIVEVADGQDCVDAEGRALIGLHVQLTRAADPSP